jgi:hypothetical protein
MTPSPVPLSEMLRILDEAAAYTEYQGEVLRDMSPVEDAKALRWLAAELPELLSRDGVCSRCHRPIVGFTPPAEGRMTAGYYVASAWRKYANPGEVYICDACMWDDPRYIADYGSKQ